jgi:hypothetical protein
LPLWLQHRSLCRQKLPRSEDLAAFTVLRSGDLAAFAAFTQAPIGPAAIGAVDITAAAIGVVDTAAAAGASSPQVP